MSSLPVYSSSFFFLNPDEGNVDSKLVWRHGWSPETTVNVPKHQAKPAIEMPFDGAISGSTCPGSALDGTGWADKTSGRLGTIGGPSQLAHNALRTPSPSLSLFH